MAGFALLAVALAWVLQSADTRALLGVPAVAWGALALAAWCVAGRRPAVLALLAGWTLCRAAWVVADRLPEALAGRDILVTGTVCEFARRDAEALRFILEADPGPAGPALPARLHLGWYDDPPALGPGQRWQLLVRLKPPRGLRNDGGFDFEEWLYARGIGATGYVRASRLDVALPPAPGACPVGGPRAALARRIEAALAGHPAAGHVLGLTVGATHLLGDADWDLLRATGTTHLLAISGLNIAMVVAPVLVVVPLLARRLPGANGHPHLAAGSALAVAGAYCALSGFAVSTVRALLMLAIAGLWGCLARPVDGRDLLALAAVTVVALDPRAVVSAGFWLSFLGVAWLMVATAPAPPRAPGPAAAGPRGRLATLAAAAWRPAAGLVRAQAVLSLGLAPVTAAWFQQFAPVGPLANLVAVPFFSVVVMPLALPGAALVMAWPAAGGLLLRLAADALAALLGGLAWLAAAAPAAPVVPWPGTAALALGGAGALLACWWRPVPGRVAAAALLLPLAAGVAREGPALRLTVLDVGQGLAALVETRRHALLYDTGPAFRLRDAGESVVLPVLRRAGLRRLDMVVVSHEDRDHAGGAGAVLGEHPGALALAPAAWPPGARRFAPCIAGRRWTWDGVRFEVVSPAAPGAWTSDNDGSCVLRVTGAGATLLLTGDIGQPREGALVARGLVGPADLVVVPHHGSRTSSGAALVAATRPRFAVVAAGHRNRWGFPAPAVVERWRSAGACVLGTAEGGALAFEAGPGGLRLARSARRDGASAWTLPDAAAGRCGGGPGPLPAGAVR